MSLVRSATRSCCNIVQLWPSVERDIKSCWHKREVVFKRACGNEFRVSALNESHYYICFPQKQETL